MSDPLTDYLRDHLAEAGLAIDLLETLRDQYENKELGKFAGDLLVEAEADRVALRLLVKRTGSGSSSSDEPSAWIGEKVSRLKSARSNSVNFGAFEALEFLAFDILGKLSLWRTLAVIAPSDTRLYGLDFDRLVSRAQEQHAQLEMRRIGAARTALTQKQA